MKRDLQIISKGLYDKPNEDCALIAAKQYIFARQKGRKILIVRFENLSNHRIEDMSFWLVQLNSDGVEIASKKITLKSICCAPREIFSPNNCFYVDNKCVDFEIRMISVTSGGFEYLSKNGEGFVKYPLEESWSYASSQSVSGYKYSKIQNNRVKFSKAILILALFLIALAVIWPFFANTLCPAIADVLDRFWKMVAEDTKELFRRIAESFEKKNV